MGFYVGIDIGAVSINSVVIDENGNLVYEHPYIRHFGKVEEKCSYVLSNIYQIYKPNSVVSVSFTGNHGRKIAQAKGLFFEFESIAQIVGTLHLVPDTKTIISMGGQDTALFQIRHNSNGSWELEYFATNGPCASGTGSFIDQQAQRLSVSMYEANVTKDFEDIDSVLSDFIALGLKSQKPSNVACRCTVFTKSDMIHLQNKGEKLEDIIYGLHLGNARNYISTIVGNRRLLDPILFIGGLSLNKLQVKAFREYFPEIRVPQYSTSLGALGVALLAKEAGKKGILMPEELKELSEQSKELPVAERLEIKLTHFVECGLPVPRLLKCSKEKVYLGIDIGSTTTKYVLMDKDHQILHKRYVTTRGKPIEVTKELLREIEKEFKDKLEIVGVATTGSGRHVVGDFLNADLMVDEITAHARGAVEIDPYVDTVFEIGGQDSKYIYIQNRNPLDFDMNKVCAAGTGSFLHELANKYGVNIVGEFQEIALSSENPVRLAERCTVFMESDLVSYHQKGARREDLLAGLCYAIVYNYLNRVVGKRKIGQRIMFLGGPSLNKAVVAAFEKVLKRPLIVPPHREVLGAYGAALYVKEHMAFQGIQQSRFRGIDSAIKDTLSFEEKICQADPNCHNQCKLRIYDFDGRKSVWGGECGRYEVTKGTKQRTFNYFRLREEILNRYLEKQISRGNKNKKKRIGIARSLFAYQTLVLWVTFFRELGFEVLLSPPTTNEIAEKGIELTLAETCFPIKVSHGHYYTIKDNVDLVFMPHMINMPTNSDKETGFYCPMVQSNSFMVKAALEIENAISPVVRLKEEPIFLAQELYSKLKDALMVTPREIERAVNVALMEYQGFKKELIDVGRRVLEGHNPEEALVVVTGRPYNLYDERLNLRLGQNLSKVGLKSLPMDFLDVEKIELSDFPSMYWGLGAQILKTAKLIKASPYMFGIHLTNFGCGPDSFLEHFYKHIMGDKPYLILELDEHSAVAGVMTRIEAFKNVIENAMRVQEVSLDKVLFS